MKESLANVNGQLEKNDMTKEAMQKLCEALRTQVTLKDEENNLKLQEETQKRIDITKNFESTMNELTKLIEVHSKHNTSLREENKMMATKLEELLAEFESRENKIHMVQGVPTSFRWEVLVKISNLREIRILNFFVKKIRQIEVRSAMLS